MAPQESTSDSQTKIQRILEESVAYDEGQVGQVQVGSTRWFVTGVLAFTVCQVFSISFYVWALRSQDCVVAEKSFVSCYNALIENQDVQRTETHEN